MVMFERPLLVWKGAMEETYVVIAMGRAKET